MCVRSPLRSIRGGTLSLFKPTCGQVNFLAMDMVYLVGPEGQEWFFTSESWTSPGGAPGEAPSTRTQRWMKPWLFGFQLNFREPSSHSKNMSKRPCGTSPGELREPKATSALVYPWMCAKIQGPFFGMTLKGKPQNCAGGSPFSGNLGLTSSIFGF